MIINEKSEKEKEKNSTRHVTYVVGVMAPIERNDATKRKQEEY